MKKIIIAFVTVLMLAGSYEAKSQINAGISFNTFYNELSPYGRWVNYPDYGQVWISNETGFEPYSTNGHWQFTNYGWMWVSNYNWGWAPFHYGRWAYLNNYGWAWVPGYEWAPAWVGWCNYDGYYGWAPLSPGIGFNYSFNSMPVNHWRFVRQQYINDPYVYRHYQRPVRNTNQYQNVTVINNTVINNNTNYVAGPAQQDVERVIKKKIEPKQVAFNNDGVKKTALTNKNEVRVFRPDAVKTEAEPAQNAQPVKKQPVKQTTVDKAETEMVKPLVVQKQEAIKQQQAQSEIHPVQKNTIQKQPIQKANDEQLLEVKRQRQQQESIKQQEQQNEARQQAIIKKQQQQDAVRQQQQIRDQQQQEIRRQEQIRQAQQQRQNELKQQRTQERQIRQQQPIQRSGFPKQTIERSPQQPVKQKREMQ